MYGNHTAILRNHIAYGAGLNYNGQLGSGENTDHKTPVEMMERNNLVMNDVEKVSIGNGYTLILRNDKTVWGMGWNEYNKLGIEFVDGEAIQNVNKAEPVQSLSNAMDIAAGKTHSLAVGVDGQVWAWGSNSHGQLGSGDTVMQTFPTKIPNLNGVISVKAGDQTSMALKSDGTVWMWGKNDQRQLGAGSSANAVLAPVQVKGENGNGYLTNIKEIALAEKCAFALDRNGQVWAWGTNANGVLGIGTSENTPMPAKVVKYDGSPLNNIKSISAGNYHCGALDYDGNVWIWGKNTSRQLGDKTRTDRYSAINPKGLNGTGILQNIESIACGYECTLAIQKDGTILAWGYDLYGRFGINAETFEMYDQPIKAFLTLSGEGSVFLPIQQGQEYIIWITGKNIAEAEKTLSVSFEAEALEMVDLCLETYEKEIVPGSIPGGQITIEEFDPNAGRLVFTANHSIPENKLYHGLLNAIKVRAKITGETKVVVND